MNEENNLPIPELNQGHVVKIYSKNAIWCFSILFAPIFGGVLLRQNLIDAKRKKEANIVLFVSIIFTALTIIFVNILDKKTGSAIYMFNICWGTILSEYFYKKYFPNETNEYKKIWKALLISIAVIIPFVLAMFFAPVE